MDIRRSAQREQADWLNLLLSNPYIDCKLTKKCVNHEILIANWNIHENLKVAMQTFKKFDEKIDWKIDQNRQKSIFNNFGWFWSSQNWQKLSLVDF